jgi:hypothetical protein
MARKLKKIVLVLIAVVAVILGYAATKPDTFSVQRSITINAPPEKIAPLLDDFHQWGAWSPWEKLDPAMKRTHSGAARGKGAVYAWEGNSQAGAGRMEVLDASAAHVGIQLDFLKPFASHNTAEFKLEPNGNSTKVTWIMNGPNLYIGKVMSVFMSMDKMIGKDFEAGLANLKARAEA